MSPWQGFQGVLVLGLAILGVQLVGCPDGAGTGNGNVNDNVNANVNDNGDGNANVNMNDNANENGNGKLGPSDDLWVTPPGSQTDYSGFSDTPVPAGFFGPTGEPFSGVITFQGAPLNTDSIGELGPGRHDRSQDGGQVPHRGRHIGHG